MSRNLAREDVESTLAAIDAVYEAEDDGDHEDLLMSARGRLVEVYDGEFGPISDDVEESDVRRALDLLSELSPSSDEEDAYFEANGERHPDRYFGWALDFVDTSARYANRVLPDPREWEVVYLDEDGNVLERREMAYADSQPTRPMIDGEPYDCLGTTWDGSTFQVYVEEAEPEPDAFVLSCWDCDEEAYADTEAEAHLMVEDHEEANPDHGAGYMRNRE